MVVVSERVARRGQRLSLGTEHAQALTSEERPNGKANTVITKALLQGAHAVRILCAGVYTAMFRMSCLAHFLILTAKG